MISTILKSIAVFLGVSGCWLDSVSAQVPSDATSPNHLVIPQVRCCAPEANAPTLHLTRVNVGVVVEGTPANTIAKTTVEVSVMNPTGKPVQAEVVLPVPHDVTVKQFSYPGADAKSKADLLTAKEAKPLYDEIVRQHRDSALLEFAGYPLIRTSSFPVAAQGVQNVQITYEHTLTPVGNRVDYVLPRSESLGYRVPWAMAMRFKATRPISTVYSPSHKIEYRRVNASTIDVKLAGNVTTDPGSFQCSSLLEDGPVTVSTFAYPNATSDGGHFLLLAGLPTQGSFDSATIKREVTLVIDRSGSMRGMKLQQVRDAALQILNRLQDGESFNILTYGGKVERFAPAPVLKNQKSIQQATAYLNRILPRGGTNVHDALEFALNQKPTPNTLPIVLFLTDGLPTVGETSEVLIRDLATKSNLHKRRIFTFGVGVDVNTPLLDNIAQGTRATPTYVLPSEDVKVKVGQVFARLEGPVLADTKIEVFDAAGKPAADRVTDLLPVTLPDLFEGDQLVLLGRYKGAEPLTLVMKGNYLGQQREFRFAFDPQTATVRHAFVPRLWAGRKIAVLVEAIRQQGAVENPALLFNRYNQKTVDPELKKLTEEVLSLTKEYGILTEYTAFLAAEGIDLNQKTKVLSQAIGNFETRAVQTRNGLGAVNQSLNNTLMWNQMCLNTRNGYWDPNMNRVTVMNVQQINDRTYFRQGTNWVDGRLVDQTQQVTPKQILTFGTPEYTALLQQLIKEGRQGSISLQGNIIMQVDGVPVLIKGPMPQTPGYRGKAPAPTANQVPKR